MRQPSVVHYPESVQQLKLGFDHLADLLAVTLGPTQGIVFSSTDLKPRPELLSDAATIARRVTELPDARQNVGAMLLRNLVWRMGERVGDGGALVAVLAQALLAYALRSVMAGANPVLVQNGLKIGGRAAIDRLSELSQAVEGQQDLATVAFGVTGERELSNLIGEIYHLLGPIGHVTVEDYLAPYLQRQYLEGGVWKGKLASPSFINAPATAQAILAEPRVVLFDGNISSIADLRPVLEQISLVQPPHLLLVAHKIDGEALNLLAATNQRTAIKTIPIALGRAGEKAQADLADLALLTEATLISPQTGRSLESLRAEDLGQARRAEAGSESLLVVGGKGDPDRVFEQIETLYSRLEALPFGEADRSELEMRIGRLADKMCILKVGAYTQVGRDYLHQRAEQGIKVVRAAYEEGVLPGGGAAYLHCIPAVAEKIPGLAEDEALGVRAVAKALEAPTGRILQNAGVQAPGVILADLRQNGPGYCYDVLRGDLVEARTGGILDAARVVRVALETAVSGAAMALSTGTLVLKKNPKVSYEP